MPLGALAILFAAIVGWPAVHLIARAFTPSAESSPGTLPVTFGPGLLLQSLAWAGVIALAATGLAWPMAWAIRRRGWPAAMLVLAPTLLPPYLAYAGWNLLRAPDSWLGSLIERAAAHGHRWVPITTGRVLAVVGLCLWAAPLAAGVLSITLRRLDEALLDQLRLDAGPRAIRHRIRLTLPGLVAAFLLTLLLMLGSAVPLHLAQMPTWSIRLWAGLDLIPPSQQGRLWLHAWPLVLIAVAGVAVLARLVSPATGWAEPGPRRVPASGSVLWACLVPVISVLAPLVLFALHVRSLRSLETFWRVSGRAVADGLLVAAAVGAISMAVVVVTWAALGGAWSRRTSAFAERSPALNPALIMVMGLTIAGLLPGVMVGAAVAGAWDGVGPIRDSAAVLILAHLARFAAVPALAGVWLRRSESPVDRDLRAVDGAVGVAGWARACWPAHRGVIVGAGLAAALLSFFEIESSVVVQPPYMDNLSRQILGYLHFARTDEMSAAAVTLLTAGLGLAVAAGWLSRPGPLSRPAPR